MVLRGALHTADKLRERRGMRRRWRGHVPRHVAPWGAARPRPAGRRGPGARGPGQSGRLQGSSSGSLESGRPHEKGDLGFGLKGHERGNGSSLSPQGRVHGRERALWPRGTPAGPAPPPAPQGRPGQEAPASVPRGSPQAGTLETGGRRGLVRHLETRLWEARSWRSCLFTVTLSGT